MAPEHIVVRLTVVPEVSLNEQLDAAQPHSPKAIAEQFITHLPAIKRGLKCACAEPLDAEPEKLDQTCLKCLAESRWRKKASEVYINEYADMSAFAEAVLGSREEAEDAIQDAFLAVFTGESEPRHLFRRLKFKCTDRLKKRRFESYDAWEGGADGRRVIEDEEDHFEPFAEEGELGSLSPEEVLLASEDREQRQRLLERARKLVATRRKYRWVKRKKWAKPLQLGRR